MTQTLLIILHLIIMFIISSQTHGFTMKMIPIESKELQMFPNNLSSKERSLFLTNISLSRAYNSPITNISKLHPNSYKLPTIYSLPKGYYVTEFEFGNGRGSFQGKFLIDTASDNTWVQCQDCNPCFDLEGKYFRYKDSRTFERMGVHHRLCDPQEEIEGSCKFDYFYSRAHIRGFLGFENFYFRDAKTSELNRYEHIAFGCGIRNENFIFGELYKRRNTVAGVHGLAPGPLSFLSQLNQYTKGRFSYCLVPLGVPNTPSNMYFGDDAQISGDSSRTVQVISMEPNALKYHLFVNGISVDGNRLPIDPSVFELNKSDYSKGFLIDSGAPNSVLVRSAYDPLRRAITHYFKDHYDMDPIDHKTEQEIFCYRWNPSMQINYPTVTFHFVLKGHGEVDMVLGRENLFGMIPKENEFCLMIFPIDNSGLSLLGAFQQTNFNFLYDVNNWMLYFVPQVCAG
ncbi:hypothetical protein RND81_05G199900 [Saponaria officinalis]|uniref:Peptidase A1 domain-containing protein n=1 Tax=Saponaria officinalis TaxID=3572 RepID=A0AAW1KUZ9_SAPOF